MSTCDICVLQNPFIKPDIQGISISNKLIQNSINQINLNQSNIQSKITSVFGKTFYNGVTEVKNKKTKLKRKIKKDVLPYILKLYKSAFFKFSHDNHIASKVVFLSNRYKQFSEFHFEPKVYPALMNINTLITNVNEKRTKSNSNEKSEIEKLEEELSNSENSYFENNTKYKELIRSVIQFFDKEYCEDLRQYYKFEIDILQGHLNALNKYKTFLESKETLSRNEQIKKANIDIKKEFSNLLLILPQNELATLPKSHDEINSKIRNLDDLIFKKSNQLNSFKSSSNHIDEFQLNYTQLLTKINKIISIEEKELNLFKQLQEARNSFEKEKRKSGIIGASKLQTAYNSFYTQYSDIFNLKNQEYINMILYSKEDIITKEQTAKLGTVFKSLYTLYHTQTPITNLQNTKILKEYENILHKHTNKNLKSLTKNNISQNTRKKINSNIRKKILNPTNISNSKLKPSNFQIELLFSTLQENLQKNGQIKPNEQLFNFFRSISMDEGIKQEEFDPIRSKDVKNITDFVSNLNDQFKDEITLLEKIQKSYESQVKNAENEIEVLQEDKQRAMVIKTEKSERLSTLRSEKTRKETEITDKKATIRANKSDIETKLGEINITGLDYITLDKFTEQTFEQSFLKKYFQRSEEEYYSTINLKKESIKNKINVGTITNINTFIDQIKQETTYNSHANFEKKISKSDQDTFHTLLKSTIETFFSTNYSSNGGTNYKSISSSVLSRSMTDNDVKKLKLIIEPLIDNYFLTIYNKMYDKEIQEIKSSDKYTKAEAKFRDCKLKAFRTSQLEDELNMFEQTLINIITELKEIEEGPAEITSVVSSKEGFVQRAKKNLTRITAILTQKRTHQDSILIQAKELPKLLSSIYSALTKREVTRDKLNKKLNIRNNVYEMFINDPLYKIIKNIRDYIKKMEESKKPERSQEVDIMKNITRYLQKRFENVPIVQPMNNSALRNKQYTLSTMIDVLKGQNVGVHHIPSNINFGKLTSEIKDERNLDEMISFMKQIYDRTLTTSQINDKKVEYYKKKYGHLVKQSGGDPIPNTTSSTTSPGVPNVAKPATNSSVVPNVVKPVSNSTVIPNVAKPATNSTVVPNVAKTSTNSTVVSNASKTTNSSKVSGSKSTEPVIKPNEITKNISSTYFIEHIYETLLKEKDKDKNVESFVKKVKELEYELLTICKNDLDNVLKFYGNSGRDKLNNTLVTLILSMSDEKIIKDIDKKLKELTERNISSQELINIYFIKKYLFMELLLIYFICYLSP